MHANDLVAEAVESERLVADALERNGYARIHPNYLLARGGDVAIGRRDFLESIRELPIDWHCTDHNRYRRYGVFDLRPWSGDLESLPPAWDSEKGEFVMEYLQSSSLNPEHAGNVRMFAALTEAQRTNRFLRWAIETCFRSLPWKQTRRSILVGVHIIRLEAQRGMPSASSPDYLHRDGEPWTFGFLLERHGVVGGENVIAPAKLANIHPDELADRAVIERFTLEQPLEGWVVDDRKVSHYVSPVRVVGDRDRGSRTILLIDFCVAIPDRVE